MKTTRYRLDREGGSLYLVIDETDAPAEASTVLLVPPFATTADDLYPAANVLVENGFRVVRFDPRHSVGRSYGHARDYRLSSVADDIRAVQSACKCSLAIGFSLATRALLRVLAEPGSLRASVLVTPILDVRDSIRRVTGVDYLGQPFDQLPASIDVLGCRVENGFVADCRENRFLDASDARVDFSHCTARLRLVCGEQDQWTDVEQIRQLASEAAGRIDLRLAIVPGATHELNRNPVIAMRFLTEMARACLELAGRDPQSARIPSFANVIEAARGGRPRGAIDVAQLAPLA